jgi:hypothetical protein
MPAVGEIIQVTARYLVDGQVNENVFNMRERNPGTTNAQIGTDILTMAQLMKAVQCGATSHLAWQWKRMTPVPFDEQFVGATNGIVGDNGGGGMNTILCTCCTLRTGVAGKTHRGRVYIGGLAGSYGTPDRLSTGGQNDFNTWATNMMTHFDDAAGTALYLALGIYSKLIGGTTPYTVAGWQPVTQIVAQSILASQRRRRLGVGI